jgi:hypothetical protein
MAVSIQNVRQEAYRLLNETNASVLGQLPDGTGGADTITSTDGVTTFIKEALTDICKTCVFIQVTATATVPVGALSLNIVGTSPAVTVSPSGSIWSVTDVYLTSPLTRLTHASEQSIRANDQSYTTTTTTSLTSILYWYRPDAYRIALYPRNATPLTVALTIYGCGITAIPANDTDAIDPILPDDVLKQILATYVAMKLIMKNVDDPSLAQRMFWRDSYDGMRMKLWMQMDAHMKTSGAPFAVPPVPQVQK